jgi:hypothetical protein
LKRTGSTLCLGSLGVAPRSLSTCSTRLLHPSNSQTQEHQSSGPAGKLALLTRALRHESPGVRHAALGELRAFMQRSRGFIHRLVAGAAAEAGGGARGGGGGPGAGGGGEEVEGLLPELMSALLACCDSAARSHLGLSMRQRCVSGRQGWRCRAGPDVTVCLVPGRSGAPALALTWLPALVRPLRPACACSCAECLGMLGAVDPGRLRPALAAGITEHRLFPRWGRPSGARARAPANARDCLGAR